MGFDAMKKSKAKLRAWSFREWRGLAYGLIFVGLVRVSQVSNKVPNRDFQGCGDSAAWYNGATAATEG